MASLYDRISDGTMSIDEITASMKAATSEGGKFYQSMEKQSQTLSGQLSTLKDNSMELLGSITSDLSDSLASVALPMLNGIIGELQASFDQGGFQGLLDSATSMIPDLLGMMTGKLQDAFSGLSRWLPQGVSQLMSALPGLLSAASDIAPQLTTALFEVAGTVVGDLVSMLPELVPALMEGILGVVEATLGGIISAGEKLYNGIEKAFHPNQQKILGEWIDQEEIAKYHFDVEVDMNTATAETEIAQAYDTIRDALSKSPLTSEQKDEILSMLGQDADAIKAKLNEFGISGAQADEIAVAISDGGEIITDALKGLNLGVNAATVVKWFAQANGSRVALIAMARAAGLQPEDITEIVNFYNENIGKIGNDMPSIAEKIYDALTDGLEDSPEVVEQLKSDVEEWADGKLKEAEEGYNAAVEKLNPKDPEYKTKLTELTTEYETVKGEIESIKDASLTIIDNLAGQSTASVEAAYQTIADLETQVNALEERVAALAGKTAEQANAAYITVTSGAKADETTINTAITYKFNKWKIDEQSAQETYQEAIEALQEQLTNGDITVEEYNAGASEAESTRDAAIAAAKAEYERAFGEILKGISESEGMGELFSDENLAKANALQSLEGLTDSLKEVGWSDLGEDKKQAIAQNLSVLVGETMTVEDLELSEVVGGMVMNAMSNAFESLDGTALSEKASAVYAAALNDGATLAGTSLDVEDASDQILAVLDSVYSSTANNVGDISKQIGTASTAGMADSAGAAAAGSETIAGLAGVLGSGVSVMYGLGAATGKAYAEGFRRSMAIQSPSRVMQELGQYTGKGLEIGLRKSMERAVQVAGQVTGGLVTSADISRGMRLRVDVPNMRDDIISANAETQTVVNLDSQQIATIQGYNNSVELAWLNTRRARGYGNR